MSDSTSRAPGIIGESHSRPDAIGKVDGTTIYPADAIRAGMLHAKVVFSHVPRAHLLSIDVTEALVLSGVVDVLTARDIPHNRFGLVEADQHVLCDIGDELRFVGDKIALVIADSPDAAELGARAVRVDLEPLTPMTDPEAAMRNDAPLVHADR